MAVLRDRYKEQRNEQKLTDLRRFETFCEGLAPMLGESGDKLSPFSSLDPAHQLRAIAAQAPKGKPVSTAPVGRYFLAAAASYFLFNDFSARKAAVLATAVANDADRSRMLAVLLSLPDVPDTLMLLYASVCADPDSDVTKIPLAELASRIRRCAEHLSRDVIRFDGDVAALRRRLREKAPEYEEALPDCVRTTPEVFAKIDHSALRRLEQFYTQSA